MQPDVMAAAHPPHGQGFVVAVMMGIDGVMYAGPIADAAAAIVCGFFTVHELRELTRLDKAQAAA